MSTNHPGVIEHALVGEDVDAERATLRFAFGAAEDRDAFREVISIDLWRDGDLGYRYAWAMPGQELAERSGVRMRLVDAPALDIWHVGLPVADLDRSLAFYTDALGLALIGRDEQADKRQAFVATARGGFTLELLASKNGVHTPRQPDHLAFECEDLEHVRTRLRASGVDAGEIASFDNGVRFLSVRDPDGTRVDLFSGRALYEADLKP
jgi:lactoylglutathione lyase